MGDATRRVGKVCIYCAQKQADTSEHVPPKLVFRRPLPPNLWTVPACKQCNGSFSKDEEYFRLLLVGLFCFSKEAEDLFDGPISRALDRARHLEDLILNALGAEAEKTFVTWDQERICRVVRKIVQGLYYREFDRVVPRRSLFKMDFVHNDEPKLSPALATGTLRDQFAPDFTYRVARVPELSSTLWQLTFYGDVHWLCAVWELASR